MKRKQTYGPVIGIFCLALLVRLIYNLTVAPHFALVGDGGKYNYIAIYILSQHCFCLHPPVPTVDRAPLWPIVIASIYSVLGAHNFYVRAFLSLLDAGTCVLIYLFVKNVFSWRVGVIAGVVAAVYPQLFIYVGWLYSETLYIFLLFALCYALQRLQRTARLRWIVGSGALLGLLALSRPNGLLVLGLFMLWIVIIGQQKILPWRKVIRGFLIVTLITLAFVIPWTIRNYIVAQAFVPVMTGEGTVLIGSYNDYVMTHPAAYGMWVSPNDANPALGRRYHFADWEGPRVQLQRESAFKNAAVQWIQSHISSMPVLLKYHALQMWEAIPVEIQFPGDRISQFILSMAEVFPIFVYPLAAFGLLVTWKRWRELLFLYLMILLVVAQSVVFYGSARLSSPIQPMILVLAAGAIWWLTERAPGTLLWMLGKRHESESDVKDKDKEEQLQVEV
jgi:4-amino-4-deoxy-L-arabinose transferase-like glycosyltransferase